MIPMSESQFSQSLEYAANEFARGLQESGARMSAAAEQFSSRFEAVAQEVRAAAARAEEARRAAEAVQMRVGQDQVELAGLMQDLRERIAALAILARPFKEIAAQGASQQESLAEAQEQEDPAPAGDNPFEWQPANEPESEEQEQSQPSSENLYRWPADEESQQEGGSQPRVRRHIGGSSLQRWWILRRRGDQVRRNHCKLPDLTTRKPSFQG